MKTIIGPSFKGIKSACYTNNKHGFYVYAKPNQCDPKAVAKYIGRYLGRPAIEFIRRLIRHIPEKHFKMLRYGGLYARRRDSDRQLNHIIPREKHKFFLSLDKWRACIVSSFGYDPLECPECGKTMLFMELYYNHQRVPLEKLYEKAMSKAHRKLSPTYRIEE